MVYPAVVFGHVQSKDNLVADCHIREDRRAVHGEGHRHCRHKMGYILMADYELTLVLSNAPQHSPHEIIRGAGMAGTGPNRARPRGNRKCCPPEQPATKASGYWTLVCVGDPPH